jgi:hypothetical protein
MDAVLGLSMTPTTVGLVLVEGQDADGATMDKDEFAVHDRGLVSAVNTSEKATAAVLRTEAIAAARGHRLHSIGVTWSEDADTEASLLLESLSESGFNNVVAVRLPEATEALARGIASVIGHRVTAVCVIEPDAVVVLVVDTARGGVQTAVNHAVATDEDLARWLSTIFVQADWRPEALVLVGSGSDLEGITPHLEDVLAVPVFVPAEAQLALARGAAMASALGPDAFLDETVRSSGAPAATPQRSRSMSPVGAASALLGAGVVTFVVSGSLALGLQLTSGESAKPAEKPAAARSAEPPDAGPLAPVAPADDSVPGAQAANGLAPNGVPLPPGVTDPVPGILPQPVNQVPVQKPGLMHRLKEKLTGIGQPDDPAQAPADAVPPQQDPLVVPSSTDAPPPPPPS